MTERIVVLAAGVLAALGTLGTLAPAAAAQDRASPEAVVSATYASLQRHPGQPFRWDLFRSLFLPSAVLVPNAEQREGVVEPITPHDFVAWIDGWTAETAPIGSAADEGFREEELHRVVHRYGDVAQIMSSYERRTWEGEEALARGVNSFQLVRKDDRWWIVSIVWDEESAAGAIPDAYLPPRGREGHIRR